MERGAFHDPRFVRIRKRDSKRLKDAVLDDQFLELDASRAPRLQRARWLVRYADGLAFGALKVALPSRRGARACIHARVVRIGDRIFLFREFQSNLERKCRVTLF